MGGPYDVELGDTVICWHPATNNHEHGTVVSVGELGVSVHFNADKRGTYRPVVPPWRVERDGFEKPASE